MGYPIIIKLEGLSTVGLGHTGKVGSDLCRRDNTGRTASLGLKPMLDRVERRIFKKQVKVIKRRVK